MFQSRTHTCGELRLKNEGEKVKIVGWLENVREVGNNFAFGIIRDFYGKTQIVVEDEEVVEHEYESVYRGKVQNRKLDIEYICPFDKCHDVDKKFSCSDGKFEDVDDVLF